MFTYKEFEIIRTMLDEKDLPESARLAEAIYNSKQYYVFKSVDEVEGLLVNLTRRGYIADGEVTALAFEEIEPLKVKSAIILAAGESEVTSKSVYSMPKGLFVKNGETLIERQIRQLKEAGIEDITVVIGYKQELYYFLQDKWGVDLKLSYDPRKNNIYSLYVARKALSKTYICDCDNYFFKNPFSKYEYNSFHSTVYKKHAKNEIFVRKNSSGRILKVFSGAKSGECIYGHAYMDENTSHRFLVYLENEIDNFRITSLFWEEFFSRHADDLDMFVREYSSDFVYEFDSLQEIQTIDSLFLGNVNDRINQTICQALNCDESEIKDISILPTGLTNISFTFIVNGIKYILRYPEESSQFFINRKNECVAERLAAKVHADDTCVYIDETGIKISIYREKCLDNNKFYYKDVELMKRLARKIRAFHAEGYKIQNPEQYEYDPIHQCERFFAEASKMKGDLFKVFEQDWSDMRRLQKYADMDGIKHTLCHNDIKSDNVLITEDTLDIIDWEFAAYSDPAIDFGRVIAGEEYDLDDPRISEILEAYFGRPATKLEYLHWMAYSALNNWFYVGYSLYKESVNETSGELMLFSYKQAKKLAAWCLPRYEILYENKTI